MQPNTHLNSELPSAGQRLSSSRKPEEGACRDRAKSHRPDRHSRCHSRNAPAIQTAALQAFFSLFKNALSPCWRHWAWIALEQPCSAFLAQERVCCAADPVRGSQPKINSFLPFPCLIVDSISDCSSSPAAVYRELERLRFAAEAVGELQCIFLIAYAFGVHTSTHSRQAKAIEAQ